jgi:hypothetical protein
VTSAFRPERCRTSVPRPPAARCARRAALRRVGLGALAVCAAAALGGRIIATCRCGAGDLELVFVLDATGSMGPVIGTVKAQAERIVEILESQVESLRVGCVAYRTRDDDEMPMPAFQDLTADRKKLIAWIHTLRAKAGGDEAVGDGIETAIHQMSWTKKARKVIVLVGDEGPGGIGERRLLALAGEAKSRGIVVHTITQSDTAWLYHFNLLRNEDPAAAAALVARYGSMKELKTSFRLPVFERTAAAGGGRAVGTGDTREIVKWLLAFALGYDDDESPPEVPPPPASPARPREGGTTPHLGRSRIGWVRYAGDWRTPRSFDGLMRHLGSLVRVDLDEKPEVVSLADPELWRYPILYLSGHGPVQLSAAERRGLARYARGGGILWADNCCGKPLFDSSLKEELAKAFPRARLARLPADHALFDVGHVVETVRYTTAHRRNSFRAAPPHVEAIRLDGREAVLYTPHSLGAGWKTYAHGMPCMMHDDDALRLSENIVLYALSR